MRGLLRAIVPLWIRRLRHHPQKFDYQHLYDQQAKHHDEREVVGDGEYDIIGRMQLELLTNEGLQPGHTLVDFGCGNGRLAVHAIPYLKSGHYVGIDICREFLRRLDSRISPADRGRVQLLHQTTSDFPRLDMQADFLCACSVFTHMEHEDAFRYLESAKQVVKPGGRLVFSCLPLDQKLSREYFLFEAGETLQQRWSRVRNVATSMEMMNAIAEMAGWRVVKWVPGDAANFHGPKGEKISFGQSACVLERD